MSVLFQLKALAQAARVNPSLLNYTPDHVNQATHDNDYIVGDNTDQVIQSFRGDDIVFAGSGTNRILSGDGNDVVVSGSGDDGISLGNGDDIAVFIQNFGNDRVNGNAGADTFVFDASSNGKATLVGFEKGTDKIVFEGFDTSSAFADAHTLANGDVALSFESSEGTAANSAFQKYALALAEVNKTDLHDTVLDNIGKTGSNGNDYIVGDTTDQVLLGHRGDDIIFLNEGTNRALGGEGNDVIISGTGADLISGGNGDDTLVFTGNYGTDRVNGNDGADTFAFDIFGSGTVNIVGYEQGVDNISLNGVDLPSWMISGLTSPDGHLQLGNNDIWFV